jgi:hypothetical protein
VGGIAAREGGEGAKKKKKHQFRLATTPSELDISAIKDQLQVYRDILKDPVLGKMLWKHMTTIAVRRQLVFEAREHELAHRSVTSTSINNVFSFISAWGFWFHQTRTIRMRWLLKNMGFPLKMMQTGWMYPTNLFIVVDNR